MRPEPYDIKKDGEAEEKNILMMDNYKRKVNKEDIVQFRLDNPCMRLAEIGRKFDISRERVRQICVEKDIFTKIPKIKYKCLNCDGLFFPKQGKPLFCSKKCHYEYFNILLICDGCGNEFRRQKNQILRYLKHANFNNTHYFCSRKCFGRYVGLNFGFGAHPLK